jgi:hypothetical protein
MAIQNRSPLARHQSNQAIIEASQETVLHCKEKKEIYN